MKVVFSNIFKRKHKIHRKIWELLGLFLLMAVISVGCLYIPKHKQSIRVPIVVPKILSKTTIKTYDDFHLLIPSLEISAPIIADVDGKDKAEYFKALQNGVAHYKDTSKPGEGGNIFIFGHSSYYASDPGEYKSVFKFLEDIKVGDEVNVWWQKKEYKYKVSKIKIVEPTDVSVLEPTDEEQLSVMTCIPPGTTEKRLIVIAKPI